MMDLPELKTKVLPCIKQEQPTSGHQMTGVLARLDDEEGRVGRHVGLRRLSMLLGQPTPGQLHTYLLANPLAVAPFFKFILTDAAHADWLGEAVEAAPSLAELTDADGRRAIDVAHSACKQAMLDALFNDFKHAPDQLHAFLHENPLVVPAFLKYIVTFCG